ncbi:hypothetical protein [Streptomyces sp. CB03234]|uniref:hypothetical protein n=1 Tax=Streptomyces sp. (strain CB03234) TaxID=1703937 RepID=UPI0018EA11A1|nr:hypothetical protein [Streptomyces sp. CB03234]
MEPRLLLRPAGEARLTPGPALRPGAAPFVPAERPCGAVGAGAVPYRAGVPLGAAP